MAAEGRPVPLAKLCRWLGVPRRSVYYPPKRRSPPPNEVLVARIKAKLEQFPTYGYCRLAAKLGGNQKPSQRVGTAARGLAGPEAAPGLSAAGPEPALRGPAIGAHPTGVAALIKSG